MENVQTETPNETLNAKALSKQAGANLDAGHFAEAASLYERALVLDDTQVSDWVNRGLALWSIDRNKEALECYERALALDSNHALAWLNRGNALENLGRYDESLESFDRALEINDQLPRAWFNKGDALGLKQRFIEAKACFENARVLGLAQGDLEVVARAAEYIERCNEILMNDYYG